MSVSVSEIAEKNAENSEGKTDRVYGVVIVHLVEAEAGKNAGKRKETGKKMGPDFSSHCRDSEGGHCKKNLTGGRRSGFFNEPFSRSPSIEVGGLATQMSD